MALVYEFGHPPPPVRIKYLIQTLQMWCGQNQSVPHSWFSPERLRELFRAAVGVIGEPERQARGSQMAFLESEGGVEYDRQLFERSEAIRKKATANCENNPG